MLAEKIGTYGSQFYNQSMGAVETFGPKIAAAIGILLLGFVMAIGVYKLTIYIFRRFHIITLIDKLNIDITPNEEKTVKAEKAEKQQEIIRQKISDKIKVDEITAKAMSYYIFLVFFRLSITAIGIDEVENFMDELLAYLPSLFIAVVIGFF
jgi:hypothetical protein